MKKSDVFIYYSGATDKTGQALQEALGITGGKSLPTDKKKLIIGWGAKTKKDLNLGAGVKALNHPDAIKKNRNKLASLEAMKTAQVPVADFVSADGVVAAINNNSSPINLPLVGRTKYHQGGTGFWLCITPSHVQKAIQDGAQYFQNFLDIKDEYRLHIVQGKLIYAQKKVPRESKDMGAHFVEQYGDKVKTLAEKKSQQLDDTTMNNVLAAMAERVQPNPDMIIRSNMRGWRFSNVKLTNISKELLDAAVNALAAINLDFGAVDCATLENGGVAIIEVNSGPGLQGTPFNKYVETFEAAIKEVLAPAKTTVKKVAAVSSKGTTEKKDSSKAASGSAKAALLAQAEIMATLADECTEEEAVALQGVWARVASKRQS